MFVIKFPKWKPTRDELELPKAQLSALATDVSKAAMTAQLEILSVESAEDLAIAIAKFKGAIAEAADSWATISEQTRHWAH